MVEQTFVSIAQLTLCTYFNCTSCNSNYFVLKASLYNSLVSVRIGKFKINVSVFGFNTMLMSI